MNAIAEQTGQLTQAQVERVIAAFADEMDVSAKRVLVVAPDHTRTCPLPQVARLLRRHVGERAAAMDFLIALGTHPPMTEAMIDKLFGVAPGQRPAEFPGSRFINHDWQNPAELRTVGKLTADQVREITGGLFAMDVDVTINRRVFEYDRVLIVGPVFPHEVVGYSGGAKYFFPGICGPELLNFFHWLGAVITCPKIIGNKDTAVRRCLHAALDLVKVRSGALCMVVAGHELTGLFGGEVKEAWSAAADLSSKVHVKWVDKPFSSVLARAPEMYDELWVGAKCMYKMEPVVADGGELIIYAPHIREISVTHGRLIEQIGYHCRDYFLADWERFKKLPWGVLAHSTHVRGIGTCKDGCEKPRINVTLATGIAEHTCRAVNLGYRDPASIDISQWQNRESQGRLYVPKAGEMLYKLTNGPDWQR